MKCIWLKQKFYRNCVSKLLNLTARGVFKNEFYFPSFSKSIYLFINNYLVPFKVTSSDIVHLWQHFSSILETLLKRAFWNRFDFSFISSIVAKCNCGIGVFSFGKRKMTADTKFRAWLRFLFLTRTSRTNIDVWTDAL